MAILEKDHTRVGEAQTMRILCAATAWSMSLTTGPPKWRFSGQIMMIPGRKAILKEKGS
jgi:hypothetical protein